MLKDMYTCMEHNLEIIWHFHRVLRCRSASSSSFRTNKIDVRVIKNRCFTHFQYPNVYLRFWLGFRFDSVWFDYGFVLVVKCWELQINGICSYIHIRSYMWVDAKTSSAILQKRSFYGVQKRLNATFAYSSVRKYGKFLYFSVAIGMRYCKRRTHEIILDSAILPNISKQPSVNQFYAMAYALCPLARLAGWLAVEIFVVLIFSVLIFISLIFFVLEIMWNLVDYSNRFLYIQLVSRQIFHIYRSIDQFENS